MSVLSNDSSDVRVRSQKPADMHCGSITGWFGVHGASIQVNPLLWKYTFSFYYILLITLLLLIITNPNNFSVF